jgi:DnaK suppressor protein
MNTKRLESLRKILDAKRREVLEEIGAELGENIDENSRFQVGNISDILDKAKVSVLHQKNERLKLIEESLMRLEDGNYGICSDCGEPIDENRLAVMPFAIYCVDCQKLHEIGQETPNL